MTGVDSSSPPIDPSDLSSVVTEHGRNLAFIHAMRSMIPSVWPSELESYRDPSVLLDLSGDDLSQVVRLRILDVLEELALVTGNDRSRHAEALVILLTESAASE